MGADLAFEALQFCFRASEFRLAACHFRCVPPSAQPRGKSTAECEREIDNVANKKENFEITSLEVLMVEHIFGRIMRKSQSTDEMLEEQKRVHQFVEPRKPDDEEKVARPKCAIAPAQEKTGDK